MISGFPYKEVKTRHRFIHHAFPNKPKREDDVVYVSEEEARVITTDFRKMDKASAEYIMKYMPTHSFGRMGKIRMQKLHTQAKEQLEENETEDDEQECINTGSVCDTNPEN